MGMGVGMGSVGVIKTLYELNTDYTEGETVLKCIHL